ncbi:transposase [Fictibacillus sp. FJAT-27399]|uniref:transposase n=1 Tax=Fictibacillus sp. FJAT-27399 TaxID=1729689 RepID=UPI0007847670|nr:transposase [Fictibacillus sp. FJAT-27399]
MRKYGKYSAEFKEFVTKQIVLDGHKMTDVCQRLDIPYDTLQKWVSAYRKKQKEAEKSARSQLLTATEYKEMYEAERKNHLELQEEVEILKKAMHIFTQEKK